MKSPSTAPITPPTAAPTVEVTGAKMLPSRVPAALPMITPLAPPTTALPQHYSKSIIIGNLLNRRTNEVYINIVTHDAEKILHCNQRIAAEQCNDDGSSAGKIRSKFQTEEIRQITMLVIIKTPLNYIRKLCIA